MKSIQVDELLRFAQAALEAAGVGAEDARTIANTLVTTDTFGVFSHGTNNLYNYIRKMQAGGLDAKAVPTVEKEGPSWAIVNGNAAMGMVSSCRAMELAIEKAKKTGIAYVGVHNSCHFGAAGYYANLAAQQGLLGIAMSNTDPNMAIPGSRDVAIGNNPFSFAAPLKNGKSVFLDIALSGAAAFSRFSAIFSASSSRFSASAFSRFVHSISPGTKIFCAFFASGADSSSFTICSIRTSNSSIGSICARSTAMNAWPTLFFASRSRFQLTT